MQTFSNAKPDTKESLNIYRTVLKPNVSSNILLPKETYLVFTFLKKLLIASS